MTTKTPETKNNSAPRGPRKTSNSGGRATKSARKIDTYELSNWLAELNLGVVPTVHVNGVGHSTAVIAVDIGSPVPPIRLTSEQMQELTSRLRRLTKELYKDEVNVRVSSDHQNGVYWSSVS